LCKRQTMATKSETGKLGEDLACRYLVDKGYKIIERNYRKPWGELDIVTWAPDRTLVFIEVKTIVSYNIKDVDNLLITPEEQLTASKLSKLKRTASLYAGEFSDKISDDKGWRIDLLALTITQKNCHMKHYENIT